MQSAASQFKKNPNYANLQNATHYIKSKIKIENIVKNRGVIFRNV